ncbi:MAG: tetratricopeptide repeat protein [Acidobacteriota bacterium]
MTWRWVTVGLLSAGLATTAWAAPGQQALKRAVESQQAGHYAEAITEYQAFLKTHPEAAAVRSNLGAALVHEGRYADAVVEYRRALAVLPTNYGIRFNLGLVYYKMGDVGRALKEFQSVYSAKKVDDAVRQRTMLLVAECYLDKGENGRVVALLEPLADKEPNNLTLDYLLGTALLRSGHERRGALMIQRLLQNGDTAEAHMLMAYTFMKANNSKGALAEIKQALAVNPNLPEAYTLRGRLDFIVSDVDGAEASFRKALKLDPNDYDALFYLGALLRIQGQLKQARPLLERALQMRPKGIRVRYQFALLCSQEGDNKRAAALLQALIKDVPEYTEAHRSLATIDFRLGRVAEGRRQMKVAKEMTKQIQSRDIKWGLSLKK